MVNIIAKFQSKATNPNGAQIVFTTHNTELMNLELLRKDQLHFLWIQGGGLLQMYGIAPFGPKYRCIVFWPKAYNLSQYRTDLAILKFAHSHLPFGFGRL